MKNVLLCRRTFIAVFAMSALMAMSVLHGIDTSMALASVAIGLAGSNAAEASFKAKFQK